jgi:paraquat-inducible protein B
MGGLAFDNFRSQGKGKPVPKGYVFNLYNSRKDAQKIHYRRELYFWVYFDESIRGLSVGAPVEFQGLKIGEVINFSLIGNADTAEFKIPILIKIEPERFTIIGKSDKGESSVNVPVFEKLLKKGFRAQLKSGNLITGELYIDLNLYPDLPPTPLKKEYEFYVIPSIPATIESLKHNLQSILEDVAAIPFEEIGQETEGMLKDLRTQTLPQINSSVKHINTLMSETDKVMRALNRNYLDSNSEINKKLIRLLDEMTRTTKSVKNLTDYLERHPESLIKGK